MKKEFKHILSVCFLGILCGCMGGGGSGPSDIRPAGSESSGLQIFSGVITANQVDVSADDGSLLPERLNVGDEVFIIFSPQGGSRPGWIRISRSPEDTAGIGWVERKSVRSFGRYKASDGSSPPTVDPGISMPTESIPLPGDIPPVSDPIPEAPPAGLGTEAPLDTIPLEPVPDNSLPTTDDPLLLPQESNF